MKLIHRFLALACVFAQLAGAVSVSAGAADPVTLSIDLTSISENGGQAVITATLPTSCVGDTWINLHYDGTAVIPADYTLSNETGDIGILALTTTNTITLTAVDNARLDGDRTAEIFIASVTGCSFDASGLITTLTIRDDETAGASGFLAPSKPDVSGVQAAALEGKLSAGNLPASIVQFAFSSTPDFSGASWTALADMAEYLKTVVGKTYLIFRTARGAVSEMVAYEGLDAASAAAEGDLVRTALSPDVYIVKYVNGRRFRRLVLNPSVFESYGHLSWSNIKLVSQTEMDTFTLSELARAAGDPTVYRLIPAGDTGARRALGTGEAYDPDSVYEINAADLASYAQ